MVLTHPAPGPLYNLWTTCSLRHQAIISSIYEPPHDKTNGIACAPSEDSDQPGHPPSLIRVFAVHMKKAWVLSYPLSAQRRLWSDWADAQADLSLRWAHMPFCWFCHEVAPIILTNLCMAKATEQSLYTQWRIRSAWASSQFDQNLQCAPLSSLWVAKDPKLLQAESWDSLIRLGECPGWSESSLSA